MNGVVGLFRKTERAKPGHDDILEVRLARINYIVNGSSSAEDGGTGLAAAGNG